MRCNSCSLSLGLPYTVTFSTLHAGLFVGGTIVLHYRANAPRVPVWARISRWDATVSQRPVPLKASELGRGTGCSHMVRRDDPFCMPYCLKHGLIPQTEVEFRTWPASAGNCQYVAWCSKHNIIPPELKRTGPLTDRRNLSELALCWLWYSPNWPSRNTTFSWQQHQQATGSQPAVVPSSPAAEQRRQLQRPLIPRLGKKSRKELDNKARLVHVIQRYEALHQCRANQIYPPTIELGYTGECEQVGSVLGWILQEGEVGACREG